MTSGPYSELVGFIGRRFERGRVARIGERLERRAGRRTLVVGQEATHLVAAAFDDGLKLFVVEDDARSLARADLLQLRCGKARVENVTEG